jgi:hypothetical protein
MKGYPNVQDLERHSGVTWRDLAELEPALAALLWEARRAGASCRRWPDVDRAFAPIRSRLAGLVGFMGKHHRHRVLGGVAAYEVAYWKLYDAVAGLLSGRAGGAGEAPETQGAMAVGGTRPAEAAALATADAAAGRTALVGGPGFFGRFGRRPRFNR